MSNNPEKPASRLSRSAEGLTFTGDALAYRITGLTAYNLDRLYVTIKAYKADTPTLFHADKLDLYYARSREAYAQACEKYLKVSTDTVMGELSRLIVELESERVAMREKSSGTEAVPPMSDAEKKEALGALKHKDLLTNIVGDFDAIGFIGERHNKALAYLATISRLQPDPLAILVLSRPGAGKTSLQNAACKFVPSESVIQYTRVTGQSLFYRDTNALKHKVLAVEEEEGLREALYSIKTLISAQKLSISATRTDTKTGKFATEDYVVNGPVVVMVSTTNPDALDDENKQRFMTLTIDESDEQTKKIIMAHRTKNSHRWYQTTSDENSITKLHHNMQRLLKPLTVTIPDELRITWPFGKLQYRREHQKFFSLIKAITLLHQYQRKTGTMKRVDGVKIEYVQAVQKDIDLAVEIGREVFVRNVDDVAPSGRSLLGFILKMTMEKHAHLKELDPKKEILLSELPFTRKELREYCGWSEAQIRRTLDHLVELGYIGRLAGRHGSTFRYVLIDDGRDDPIIDWNEANPKKPDNEKSTT
jgi:hypothetical protein